MSHTTDRIGSALTQPLHTLEAIEDADVLEVATPEVDDVIRLADRYGRGG